MEWFLDSYRPPVTEIGLAAAEPAFLADRALHVRPMTLRDYTGTLALFRGSVGDAANVHLVNPGLVSRVERGILPTVTATDVIKQIEALPPSEQAQVRDWLHAQEVSETPAMLAALDAAGRSADERGTTSIADVRQMLPTWISKSA